MKVRREGDKLPQPDVELEKPPVVKEEAVVATVLGVWNKDLQIGKQTLRPQESSKYVLLASFQPQNDGPRLESG